MSFWNYFEKYSSSRVMGTVLWLPVGMIFAYLFSDDGARSIRSFAASGPLFIFQNLDTVPVVRLAASLVASAGWLFLVVLLGFAIERMALRR